LHCDTSRKVSGSIPGVAEVSSVASDSSMCPGVDSASNNEYQVNPGGKGGRCARLTTYHLHVPMSRNLGPLTSCTEHADLYICHPIRKWGCK
jgi:hypothetical protein